MSVDRSVFDRVLAVHNGKGGTYKTSIAANVAGVVAQSGSRVLLVDMDPQGNLGIELGYDHQSDDGKTLTDAMLSGAALSNLLTVRDNLDVAAGGTQLERILPGVGETHDLLATSLDAVVDDYDLIMIDTPPSSQVLIGAALGVAHHLLIPTQPDAKSMRGLRLVGEKVVAAQEHNPYLGVLGAVLVGIPVNARQIRQQAREDLEQILGDGDLLMQAAIRHSQKAATTANERGLLASELAAEASQDLADGKHFYDYLRAGQKVPQRLDAAPGLAADYAVLTSEIVDRLNAAAEQYEDTEEQAQ